jgi:hypothetical protein
METIKVKIDKTSKELITPITPSNSFTEGESDLLIISTTQEGVELKNGSFVVGSLFAPNVLILEGVYQTMKDIKEQINKNIYRWKTE